MIEPVKEQREAAERVQRLNNGELSKIVYGWGSAPLDDGDCQSLELERIKDYKTLADFACQVLAAGEGQGEAVLLQKLNEMRGNTGRKGDHNKGYEWGRIDGRRETIDEIIKLLP